MKIPLSWLKEYIPASYDANSIAEMLTDMGLEVDDVHACDDGDFVFDISLTPNLAHAASVRGVARELSSVLKESLLLPAYCTTKPIKKSLLDVVKVTVKDPAYCPRYACKVIQKVVVGPSPKWLKDRIEKCGIRSVNNIVDITNLILMELGQPLHAFDFDLISGKQIIVRTALPKEHIVTLDGKERILSPEMLVICDSKLPIAIAGIIGGRDTEVSSATKTIFLESAYFTPSKIRWASKSLELYSEASFRFERGCDPNMVLEALERATNLICDIAKGEVLSETIDISSKTFSPHIVCCRVDRVNKILGTQLSGGEMETLLRHGGFGIISVSQHHIEVSVPTYRHDVSSEIDLVEEVGRIYGFKNICKPTRPLFRTCSLSHAPSFSFERSVRHRLLSEGLQELSSCDLISEQDVNLVDSDRVPKKSHITLLNPSSLVYSVLRPSLLPALLRVVKTNIDRGVDSLAGFEIGKLHVRSDDGFCEPSVLSIILTGRRAPYHWESKENNFDFFDLKGIVENLFIGLHGKPPVFSPGSCKNFHPGRQAAVMLDGHEVAVMGALHPDTLQKVDIKQDVYFIELNMDSLRKSISTEIKMAPLPLYPASARDITLTVDEDLPVGVVYEKIKTISSSILESVLFLDLYRGEHLGSDRKNITFRFVYRDHNKTLSFEDVDREHSRIINLMKNEELKR